NIKTRLTRHNEGRVPFTKNKGPWKLVYTEGFDSRSEAMRREKQIKKWSRNQLVKLIEESRESRNS
ncbi:MAG: GIY-YIG nuclease family protein, partial [Candidatus Neomarinimicrobiota bacterium]